MHPFSRAGFTLIEIVVVIAIVASLTGLLSANYVQYAEEKKLQQEVINLKTVLTLARTKSLAGDIGTYPCGNFYGYRISSDLPNRKINTHLCCGDGCAGGSNAAYQTGSYTIPESITVRTNFALAFLSFAKGTDLAEDLVIELKNTSIGKCAFIRVSKVGLIEAAPLYRC
ncbi:MAG: prepilin-type N-terminal cleavage/methylation domain-containing protein [Patescibacteria group bacterium]|nr:prepilin-type N-terminal cleavage/methylation domain-containing protein [Patescibacteria group bacterium]